MQIRFAAFSTIMPLYRPELAEEALKPLFVNALATAFDALHSLPPGVRRHLINHSCLVYLPQLAAQPQYSHQPHCEWMLQVAFAQDVQTALALVLSAVQDLCACSHKRKSLWRCKHITAQVESIVCI